MLKCAFSPMLAMALLLAATSAAWCASMNRFVLAGQSDFGTKHGFYLEFENEAPDGTACKIGTLKLYLGVASGTAWSFTGYAPPQGWEYGHDYTARVVIGAEPAGGATLSIDGQPVATDPNAHLSPDHNPLTAGERPGWASGPAEYLIRQSSLHVRAGGTTLEVPFPPIASRPLALYLFEPNTPSHPQPFTVPAGSVVAIEATFRIEAYPTDLHSLAPFVDDFGQSLHSEWPGKVRTDSDLIAAMHAEEKRNAAWGAPRGYDAYGGSTALGWHQAATGFFHTARRGDRWWLISPLGNPTFYIGLCTAPALAWDRTPVTGREYLFSRLPAHTPPPAGVPDVWGQNPWGQDPGVDFLALHSANMAEKYGPTAWPARARASLTQRLSAWGFSGMSKWCDPVGALPRMPVLRADDVPKIARHIDIFDPALRAAFAASLAKQIIPGKNDPTLIGWSFGNEYDEVITRGEVLDILKQHPESPAAKALTGYAATHLYGGDAGKRDAAWKSGVPTDADLEALRQFYADRYYDFLYTTVKAYDPNHLYFGFWIVPGWWENESDWKLIAPHCDVIGYDHYAPTFADARLQRLAASTGKPIFCGEFSFPPWYEGTRGFGRYDAANAAGDADAGAQYARWIKDAAQNPYCVGVSWFQYRDEPITGRGPGHGDGLVYGEHYAFGLVDTTDSPKWDLVTLVRDANLHADTWRQAATGAAK